MIRLLSPCVAIGLTAGLTSPAAAAEPPITYDDAQLAGVLFGAAMRVKDAAVSAEMDDWRQANRGASEADFGAHVSFIRTTLDTQLTPIDAQRSLAELHGRIMEIIYSVAGPGIQDAVITGGKMTNELAAALRA